MGLAQLTYMELLLLLCILHLAVTTPHSNCIQPSALTLSRVRAYMQICTHPAQVTLSPEGKYAFLPAFYITTSTETEEVKLIVINTHKQKVRCSADPCVLVVTATQLSTERCRIPACRTGPLIFVWNARDRMHTSKCSAPASQLRCSDTGTG